MLPYATSLTPLVSSPLSGIFRKHVLPEFRMCQGPGYLSIISQSYHRSTGGRRVSALGTGLKSRKKNFSPWPGRVVLNIDKQLGRWYLWLLDSEIFWKGIKIKRVWNSFINQAPFLLPDVLSWTEGQNISLASKSFKQDFRCVLFLLCLAFLREEER